MKWKLDVVNAINPFHANGLGSVCSDIFLADGDFRGRGGLPLEILHCTYGARLSLSEWHGGAHTLHLWGAEVGDHVVVSIQLDGEATFSWDGGNQRAIIRAGEYCVYPVGQSVTYSTEREFRRICLRFPLERLESCCPGWQLHAYKAQAFSLAGGELFVSLVAALQRHGETVSEDCCEQVFLTLLNMFFQAMKRSVAQQDLVAPKHGMARQRKRDIREYVTNNLTDPDLSVTQVAGAVGLSERYVSHLFASDRLHLMQWVWRERLSRCCHALKSENADAQSITSIAYAWGFSDTAHFSRAFRRQYGMSPSQFRKNTQQVRS